MFVKRCYICERDRPISDFAKHTLAADGLSLECVECGGVDMLEFLEFFLRTSRKTFALSACAMIEGDEQHFRLLLGRLDEIDERYLSVLRQMTELILKTLDELERGQNE